LSLIAYSLVAYSHIRWSLVALFRDYAASTRGAPRALPCVDPGKRPFAQRIWSAVAMVGRTPDRCAKDTRTQERPPTPCDGAPVFAPPDSDIPGIHR
jgi:hypothetical protein